MSQGASSLTKLRTTITIVSGGSNQARVAVRKPILQQEMADSLPEYLDLEASTSADDEMP
jgi:hypothetical protein